MPRSSAEARRAGSAARRRPGPRCAAPPGAAHDGAHVAGGALEGEGDEEGRPGAHGEERGPGGEAGGAPEERHLDPVPGGVPVREEGDQVPPLQRAQGGAQAEVGGTRVKPGRVRSRLTRSNRAGGSMRSTGRVRPTFRPADEVGHHLEAPEVGRHQHRRPGGRRWPAGRPPSRPLGDGAGGGLGGGDDAPPEEVDVVRALGAVGATDVGAQAGESGGRPRTAPRLRRSRAPGRGGDQAEQQPGHPGQPVEQGGGEPLGQADAGGEQPSRLIAGRGRGAGGAGAARAKASTGGAPPGAAPAALRAGAPAGGPGHMRRNMYHWSGCAATMVSMSSMMACITRASSPARCAGSAEGEK